MTARRAGLSAVALTVLAVGLMLLMVMFAARSGPERIFAGPMHDPSIRPVDPSYTPPVPPHGNGHAHGGLLHSSPLFRALGVVLEVAVAACLLWLLWRGARGLWEQLRYLRRRQRRKAPEPVEFEVLDDPEALAAEIRGGADEQLGLLLGGSPRNAIVACWDRFEDYAERVHSSRRSWETSSEFVLRLLDSVSADTDAVLRLEALFREARFSAHVIGEDKRDAAVGALRAIHASLGVGVGSP